MKTVEERIKAAEEKLKQLKASAQKIEARKRDALAKQTRAADTRKKILAGALMLEIIERSPEEKENFTNRLKTYLTRDGDRALFGLPPLQKVGE